MPKKIVEEEPEPEPEEVEPEEAEPEPVPEPVPVQKVKKELPPKPKKVLTQKQLDALARGRQLGVERLRQKGTITRQQQAVQKDIKELKQQERIQNAEELSKYADISYVRKTVDDLNNKFLNIYSKFENIDGKFSNFLTEKEQRKKEKDSRIVEETIKKELPRAVNDIYFKQKLNRELSNNPFLGRV